MSFNDDDDECTDQLRLYKSQPGRLKSSQYDDNDTDCTVFRY